MLSGHAEVARPPMKAHYMVDRFGELTIIVLAEFFIKIVTSASEREFSRVTPIYFASLLSVSASLWWLYFDHLEHSALASLPQRMKGWVVTPVRIGVWRRNAGSGFDSTRGAAWHGC